MNVAIFGSCVSRDTCEYMPTTAVLAYVARQSVTSLITPHGSPGVDLSELSSAFQRRMVAGDLEGDGARRLVDIADSLDVILVDLIDERRGFWRFPDGTSMTNSVEVELSGGGRSAMLAGAHLVEFGTDEHFEAWGEGFEFLVAELGRAEVLNRAMLIDVEWAAALAGAPHPHFGAVGTLGRRVRRLRRGAREAGRRLARGDSPRRSLRGFLEIKPTEAEEFADRAAIANAKSQRYREVARSAFDIVITRSSSELRIDHHHKWGPQPFHFRDVDYHSIAEGIETNAEARR